jgi:hypothetical protein
VYRKRNGITIPGLPTHYLSGIVIVMDAKTVTEDRFDDLLKRVRAGRSLPPADERRARRQEAGCSLREVGAAVGASFMAVKRWEEGARPRNPEHLAAYSRLLEELKQ